MKLQNIPEMHLFKKILRIKSWCAKKLLLWLLSTCRHNGHPSHRGSSTQSFGSLVKNQTNTGSPHFTQFHFAWASLYLRLMIFQNEFKICNTSHDFLTLHWQKSNLRVKFHFTWISLYMSYLEKHKSCKVRATCSIKMPPTEKK